MDARYALVVYPGSTVVACITLDAVSAAVARGALVVAREDAMLSEPVPPPILVSGPRRYTDPHEWRRG